MSRHLVLRSRVSLVWDSRFPFFGAFRGERALYVALLPMLVVRVAYRPPPPPPPIPEGACWP